MNHTFRLAMVAVLVWLSPCRALLASDTTPAWSHYTAYRTALEEAKHTPRFRDFVTKSMIAPLDEASNAREREELRNLLAFPLWLKSTTNHFEREVSQGRCLTVNGHNERGEPMAIAVRMKDEADGLRIAEIHAVYLPHTNAWPDRAHCPDEPGLADSLP